MLSFLITTLFQVSSIELALTSNFDSKLSEIDLKKSEHFRGLEWLTDFDLGIYVDLSVGTPGQSLKLKVVMDESSVFLLKHSLVSSTSGFNTIASSSLEISEKSFKFFESNKEISGYWASDSMIFGSLEGVSQTFGLISNQLGLDDFQKDGILGLGLKLIHKTKGFVYNLHKHKKINDKIFSVYINNPEIPNDHPSVLAIGEWNPSKYGNGVISNIKVNLLKEGWVSGMKNVKIGAKQFKTLKNTKAVFDLGSPYLELNSSVYLHFQEEVMKKFDCVNDSHRVLMCYCYQGSYSEFPEIGYEVNNQVFNVNPQSYIYFADHGDYYGECYLLVRSQNSKKLTIGYPFFKEYYTMFDYSKHKIKFSKANKNSYESSILKNMIIGLSAVLAIGCASAWRFMRHDDYKRIV